MKIAFYDTHDFEKPSAGFNNVDLTAAAELGLTVVRVPEYSPYAVAEHAVALILALNRKTEEALYNIAQTTLENISDFEQGKTFANEVRAELHLRRSP